MAELQVFIGSSVDWWGLFELFLDWSGEAVKMLALIIGLILSVRWLEGSF